MCPSLVRLIVVSWNLLLVGVCAVAAPAAPQKVQKPSAGVQQPSGGKHCLWRVRDAKAPVYLLGSIHSMRKNDYPLPAVIEQAMEQSQQFYFEFDPKGDDELDRKLTAAAALPKGVQLRQKINPRTWKFLLQCATGKITDGSASAPGPSPCLFSNTRFVYLLEAIVVAHQSDARYREMIKDWRMGNTERLYQLEMPDISDAPGLNPRFLQRRNIRWIPKIEDAIKSGTPTMIVAGGMHFSGPNSVLTMLRARGYNIEQL